MRGSLLLAAVLAAATAIGQGWGEPPASWRDRLWYGGGIGLNLGTVTFIQLDPLVGYKVDKKGRASLGAGPSYWYYRDNRWAPPLESSGGGYRLLGRYRFIEQAFAHAEFYHLHIPKRSRIENQLTGAWVPHLLLGGGYVQRLGGRSSFFIQALWEVLQHPYSVYRGRGPIIGGGVGIGF
ncbi:MAG: hypothetical protein ACK4L7_02875 [Flavobacteriales bacterium]